MNQSSPSRIAHSAGASFVAIAGAALRGVFEVVALARSRWTTRVHHGHDDMTAGRPRG